MTAASPAIVFVDLALSVSQFFGSIVFPLHCCVGTVEITSKLLVYRVR